MERKLTIYHLYPDLLDVYADRGNVAVLEKRCAWRGIETRVRTLRAGETPDFADVDIVLLGTGSAQGQKQASGYREMLSQPLKAYVENDGVLLAIGAGYQLLGNFYETETERIDGYGVLDMDTYVSAGRFVGHFAVEAQLDNEKVTLVGFEHHTGRTDIKDYAPLGCVLAGFGNAEDGREGILYKNTIGTYMHGPILPKNPALADFLIQKALTKKYGDATLAMLDDSAAQAARNVILERLK
ncbi:MAG: glutamine amidotransferase [Clostridia bacterium]|nr:glutamine amidotransferase [Clostridia bacterium]